MMKRRDFFRSAAIIGGAALLGEAGTESEKDSRLVRGVDPVNLEFPFASLKDFLTPTALHYVRNHYPVPNLEERTFQLQVFGRVQRPLTLTLGDLRKMKKKTVTVTMECAGNGRSFLPIKAKGVQWAQGAVSTAEWTGTPLAEVLALARLEKDAVEVVFDSADKGDPKKEGQPPGLLSFNRSISLTKAGSPEVLLAYEMNGQPLPPNHGYPLRAIVPGWYGMASVKWLTRVIVTRDRFDGFDQTIDYAYWRNGEDGLPRLSPLTVMQPKAQIATPEAGAKRSCGEKVRVFGAAWAGEKELRSVQVSSDGGKNWQEATFIDKGIPYCWRRWEWMWTPKVKGEAVLMAKATDATGATQPLTHDAGRRSYMINFVQRTPVTIT